MIFKNRKHTEKIFCIGAGKTGNTSLKRALNDFNYIVGDQAKAELLLDDYANRNFKPIIEYSKTAEAFQDAPFCFQHTYIPLAQYFKNAKFILSVRDTDDQWYNSLTQFHTKKFSSTGGIPTWEDLKNANYRYQGYVAEVRKRVFGIHEDESPFHEQKLKNYYNTHNASVIDFFKNKDNLLVINVSKEDSYKDFCKFLDRKPLYEKFPWENKTSAL